VGGMGGVVSAYRLLAKSECSGNPPEAGVLKKLSFAGLAHLAKV
jgi:hypothetical protein